MVKDEVSDSSPVEVERLMVRDTVLTVHHQGAVDTDAEPRDVGDD